MTETMPRARNRRARRALPAADVLAALAFLAVMAWLMRLLEDPPRAEFTIRNDTVWDLTLYVEVDDDSVMPVAVIGAERANTVSEVISPGDEWRFIWRFTGDDIGTSAVADEQLQRRGFELTVPDDVADALRAADAPPAP